MENEGIQSGAFNTEGFNQNESTSPTREEEKGENMKAIDKAKSSVEAKLKMWTVEDREKLIIKAAEILAEKKSFAAKSRSLNFALSECLKSKNISFTDDDVGADEKYFATLERFYKVNKKNEMLDEGIGRRYSKMLMEQREVSEESERFKDGEKFLFNHEFGS